MTFLGRLGYVRESHTGSRYLTYVRARRYQPSTGRFISVDPERDGINWYIYAGNRAITFADPTGLYILDKSCTDTPHWGRRSFGGIWSMVRSEQVRDFVRCLGNLQGQTYLDEDEWTTEFTYGMGNLVIRCGDDAECKAEHKLVTCLLEIRQ